MPETSFSPEAAQTAGIPMAVFAAFGLHLSKWRVIPFGMGLINRTWKIENNSEAFIIQRINQQVFRQPDDIAYNMNLLAGYLQQQAPDYLFVSAQPTPDGHLMVHIPGDGFYRLFPFVMGSHTLQVLETPDQAFEAARQFGRFTRLLDQFDVGRLRTTIPAFHDLTLRYQQFVKSIDMGVRQRVQEAQILIQQLIAYSDLVNRFEEVRKTTAFRKRVIHHDTKISNVLFDEQGKGLCVIDLDTVMPGFFISDIGDMMRTYLCPVSEEEKELDRIQVRSEFYQAIRDGYMGEMQSVLSAVEQNHFFYSGQFMIYMQALRFLTDHLLGDPYYGAAYPGHNLLRAKNQLRLLDEFTRFESVWQ